MKFREIFRFEFLYQARRVRTWLYFAVLFIVAFLLDRTAGVVNSPYAIAQETVLTSLVWILMAPAVAGSAVARDVQTRMHPLVYTAPIHKADYLGGRFLGALVINALILLAVPLGILTAFFLPGGVAPQVIAPLRPAVYLSSYGVLALPTAFTFTAVQFSLAALKGRATVSYLGSVVFFFTVSLPAALLINVFEMPTFGTLLDPLCRITVLNVMAETLTPLQMNTVLVALDTSILANRVLWIGIALAILAFTHARFRLAHRAG